MKLRLGLVGLGPSWANRHRPALQTLAERFEVRAVCDPVAHRAEQVARELGARPCDGFRCVAAAEDVDALMILSARWFGPLPIFAACDHSKAVYYGAPVDLPADRADALRKRVKESGIAFMAEFPNRLAPATIRLQELIATRLGKPRLLICNQRLAPPTGDPTMKDQATRRLVEMVDWCRYVVGEEVTSILGAMSVPKPTSGANGAPAKEGSPAATDACQSDDYSLLTLQFAPGEEGGPGAAAQIACGSYAPPELAEAASFRRPADMQVVCERGIAFVDLPSTVVWFDAAGQHTETLQHERPVGERLLMQFHRSVASLVLRTASLEDGYRAMAIVGQARRSCREGRRIDIAHGPMPAR
ncbi:MAG: Gfo/Idh/MocA family oxidoreductase [Planctomycetota bacterium]